MSLVSDIVLEGDNLALINFLLKINSKYIKNILNKTVSIHKNTSTIGAYLSFIFCSIGLLLIGVTNFDDCTFLLDSNAVGDSLLHSTNIIL